MSEFAAEPKGLGTVVLDVGNDVGQEGSSQTALMSELSSYLGNLGLGDEHLAKVISLMQATNGQAIAVESPEEIPVAVQPAPDDQGSTSSSPSNEKGHSVGFTPDHPDSRIRVQ